MSTATLQGHAVTSCRISLPAWGVPFADVEIAVAETLTGRVTLVLADLTFVGTVLDGGIVQGRARYRIIGGAGGWGRTIAAKPYANDLGVKFSTLLTDAASACGETLGTVPAGTAGPAYVRASAAASTVLDDLFARGWYVDLAGVTQIGARAVTTYAGGAPRTGPDPADSRIELAADAIATLIPGVTVDGTEAVDVEHALEGGKLRTTLWGRREQRTGNRAAAALVAAIEHQTASHRYFAPWEYRVVSRSGERLNLQVVRAASGMPNLSSVHVRPGVAGLRARPKLGSLVVVAFVNGDASRPMVVSFDDPEGPGWIPDEVYAMAGATGAQPTEHGTSAEATVNFVYQLLTALLAPLVGQPAIDAALLTAIAASVSGELTVPVKTAVDLALSTKAVNSNGRKPSLGWPNVWGA